MVKGMHLNDTNKLHLQSSLIQSYDNIIWANLLYQHYQTTLGNLWFFFKWFKYTYVGVILGKALLQGTKMIKICT